MITIPFQNEETLHNTTIKGKKIGLLAKMSLELLIVITLFNLDYFVWIAAIILVLVLEIVDKLKFLTFKVKIEKISFALFQLKELLIFGLIIVKYKGGL